MTRKLKKRLIRIILCAIAFLIVTLITKFFKIEDSALYFLLYAIVYVGIGIDIIKKAFLKLIKGKPMDENMLMTIASIGAFFISECKEAVVVMLFYQIGEWFQSFAVGKSRSSIKSLMDIRPDYANILLDEEERTVDPNEVSTGDIIIIKPGEKVPLDGEIIEGYTSLDTKALTGESVPRDVSQGESVISGCINLTNVIKVKVTKEFGQSTVSKILDLVENATSKKADTENFITKFARYYTPLIVTMAVLVCVIPTFIMGGDFMTWLYRALSFLVISCPCALVISIPLGFFGGIGGASRLGILVKGSNHLEALSKVDTVVMDKTGTLTKGVFEVKNIVPSSCCTKEELLELAAVAESYSSHPIAVSLQRAYDCAIDKCRLTEVKEIAGQGIEAIVDGQRLYVGNAKLINSLSIQNEAVMCDNEEGTVCFIADEQKYLGYILIADQIKDDATTCIEALKRNGVERIVMLTGDREASARMIASKLGITSYYSNLLPTDKVEKVDEIILSGNTGCKTIFVGDGINDAPVLARADIGIAMGAMGCDAAIEAADIVIMNDEPSKIVQAMEISRRTLKIVKENIILSLAVKALILVFATFGIATMWAAIFADVGVAFLAILNSMRTLKV